MNLLGQTFDPTTGQTVLDIQTYLRSSAKGAEVAIRNTHAGVLTFRIAQVTDTKPSAGRVYTDKTGFSGGNAWYAKTGKNCVHPKGQSRLFIPTDTVRAYIETHPDGALTYSTHNPDGQPTWSP